MNDCVTEYYMTKRDQVEKRIEDLKRLTVDEATSYTGNKFKVSRGDELGSMFESEVYLADLVDKHVDKLNQRIEELERLLVKACEFIDNNVGVRDEFIDYSGKHELLEDIAAELNRSK